MHSTPVMKTAAGLAALSFAAALAGAAMAQQPPTDPMPAEEAAMSDDATADAEPAPAAADIAADTAQPAGIPTSSPTPVEQAYLLKAGDPTVVSNPPVPDTLETRRAYGGPESNGGKKTRAVGN